MSWIRTYIGWRFEPPPPDTLVTMEHYVPGVRSPSDNVIFDAWPRDLPAGHILRVWPTAANTLRCALHNLSDRTGTLRRLGLRVAVQPNPHVPSFAQLQRGGFLC